mmetsp:Transcript_420/g.1073  ORF Transcript_420/g.1073 Transcript_420/m.1073 type:complete len:215 (+) Transcript_420:728-1372(+)
MKPRLPLSEAGAESAQRLCACWQQPNTQGRHLKQSRLQASKAPAHLPVPRHQQQAHLGEGTGGCVGQSPGKRGHISSLGQRLGIRRTTQQQRGRQTSVCRSGWPTWWRVQALAAAKQQPLQQPLGHRAEARAPRSDMRPQGMSSTSSLPQPLVLPHAPSPPLLLTYPPRPSSSWSAWNATLRQRATCACTPPWATSTSSCTATLRHARARTSWA